MLGSLPQECELSSAFNSVPEKMCKNDAFEDEIVPPAEKARKDLIRRISLQQVSVKEKIDCYYFELFFYN